MQVSEQLQSKHAVMMQSNEESAVQPMHSADTLQHAASKASGASAFQSASSSQT